MVSFPVIIIDNGFLLQDPNGKQIFFKTAEEISEALLKYLKGEE